MFSIKRFTQCRQFSTINTKIGFVGLGQMGGRMAGHLTRQGYHPLVYDNSIRCLADFKKQHPEASIAQSLNEIATKANVIFTMLPTGDDVKHAYFGNEGLLTESVGNDPLILVDCSTSGPMIIKDLSQRVEALGHHLIDAPVTGGVQGAEKASLTFMCGGDGASVEKLKPLFAAMGRHVFHCGGSGTGQIAKLCNNSILGVTMVVVSEALLLAERAGVDPRLISDVLNVGTGRSWVTEVNSPVPGVIPTAPASHNYKPGFRVELIEKDLRLMLDTAEQFKVAVPSISVAREKYSEAIAAGRGEEDFSTIYKH